MSTIVGWTCGACLSLKCSATPVGGCIMSAALLAYIRARERALWMWRKVKRGLTLLGAFGLAVFGAAFGYVAAMAVRQPDAVLLELARQIHVADPPSVRDLFLFEFGCGIVLTMWGLYFVRAWFRPAQNKESV
jgi:hypothetical protein